MTEKTVQPGEENGHRDTGDSKTDGTGNTQEDSQTGSFSLKCLPSVNTDLPKKDFPFFFFLPCNALAWMKL